MTRGAEPHTGDVFLSFNGRDAYVEIPNLADYSVSATGELTVSVWMRPDSLNFPKTEPKRDYIHWLGKGDASGKNGNQEWTFRMYNHSDPLDHPARTNRISFYLFNPEGGLGVGSFVQVPVHKGQWIQVTSVADATRTYFYRDGKFVRCDTYRGPQQGSCEIHFQDPPNSNQQLEIEPQAGSAPLRVGTKDLGSFFEGGLARLRIWSRALGAHEIAHLYSSDAAPLDGLVGEFLMNADTGASAIDTAQGNNGSIVNGAWAVQS